MKRTIFYKLIGWSFILTILLMPFGVIILELADLIDLK